MQKITIHNKEFQLFLPSELIQSKIVYLASQIASDYLNKEVCFVSVLNGALFFSSDLILNYNAPCTLETIKCKSYEGMHSTGNIQFQLNFSDEM